MGLIMTVLTNCSHFSVLGEFNTLLVRTGVCYVFVSDKADSSFGLNSGSSLIKRFRARLEPEF